MNKITFHFTNGILCALFLVLNCISVNAGERIKKDSFNITNGANYQSFKVNIGDYTNVVLAAQIKERAWQMDIEVYAESKDTGQQVYKLFKGIVEPNTDSSGITTISIPIQNAGPDQLAVYIKGKRLDPTAGETVSVYWEAWGDRTSASLIPAVCWEYRVEQLPAIHSEIVNILKPLGKTGWQLLALQPRVGPTGSSGFIAILGYRTKFGSCS